MLTDNYKNGKSVSEMDIIMKDILIKYGLKNEKVENDYKLKDYIKKGFKCLTTFYLNNLEWNNFENYSQNFKEGMVFTKNIIKQ